MNITAALREIPLFKGLADDDVKRLAAVSSIRTLKRGDLVFSEGQEADGFYVVLVGRVKVFKASSEGREQVLHIINFQEPFGEVAMFEGGNFPANAQALEDSKLLFFSRSGFVRLIAAGPDLAMKMLAVLSARLRQFTRFVEELSLKDVPGRLASYLLYLGGREGGSREVDLDIPKALLANLLGTVPETLSRVLSKMGGEGLIAVKGRKVRLLDVEGLERLAGTNPGLRV